ncbi:hypothetical protein CLV35_1511 [Motilibacter peucedani]|uniref:Pantothenate kinase n=1 Tax=Motilibacter peucedani TaxID=598650 RepID=A0A420XSG3_9ACTN|nr:nucleoside/nucleotide kinase family protein [Motilibacter peucedani]RKS77813.1 hypothetical protein CLV35_1511 [Motilibacter peucedani]
MTVTVSSLAELVARAEALAAGPRRVLGIAGPPGGGKSTVAEAVVAALGDRAALVPMDGFHLAQAQLERLGRADRKGAPDTFDAEGYAALLRRLRDPGGVTVYAPAFRREIEEPVAGAVAVAPEVPLVVTEGNYLLLEDGPWAQVLGLLDETWLVRGDEEVRVERLIARHVRFGRSPEEAREWVLRSDEANAALVAERSATPDVVVDAHAMVLPG